MSTTAAISSTTTAASFWKKGNKTKLVYPIQRLPSGKEFRLFGEWLRLWRFRFGIETGIDELEPAEKFVCCTKPLDLGSI